MSSKPAKKKALAEYIKADAAKIQQKKN